MNLLSLLKPAWHSLAKICKGVPEEGLEPSRHYWQWILSPQRLPFRHSGIGFDLLTNQLRGIEPFSLEITDLLISSD